MPDTDMSIEAAVVQLGELLADAIRERRSYASAQILTYVTGGGTYILASTGLVNDDGRVHDIAAIGRGGDVVPLTFAANPATLAAMRKIIEAS